MKVPFTGGCACGAIRYECSAEPIMTFKCHCRDCRRATGGGHVAAMLVPASAFRLTKGQLRYHFTPSTAVGKHKRGFCPECGSRLMGGESAKRPTGFVGVTAGSLDDPSWFRSQMDFFTSDAQPWDPMDPAIPKYELYPPSPRTLSSTLNLRKEGARIYFLAAFGNPARSSARSNVGCGDPLVSTPFAFFAFTWIDAHSKQMRRSTV